MQEKIDYYTTYFKGHASQNDNPAVKHKYMDVLLELKERKKRKKNIINFLLTNYWILICLFVLMTSLKIVAFLLFQWADLAPTESYARFCQIYAEILTPKLAFQDNLTVFPNTLHNTGRLYL